VRVDVIKMKNSTHTNASMIMYYNDISAGTARRTFFMILTKGEERVLVYRISEEIIR